MKLLTLFFTVFTVTSVLWAEQRRPFTQPQRAVRQPANQISTTSSRGLKIGGVLGFDGLWGKTATSDVLSKGLGYSVGLTAGVKISERVRATLIPSYQYLRLGRAFDNSGQLQEPTPANLEQSIRAIGISVIGSYELERGEVSAPVWWLDLGGQYLMPLSASQTVAGSTVSFTANKSFLLLLGTTMDLRMEGGYDLTASLQGTYSLPGSAEGKIFGVRLLAGITFRI